MPDRSRGFELVLLALAAMVAAGIGYRFGGQIAGTDTLLYLDRGMRGVADPFILNRYTHVHLLAALDALAGSPFAGMQLLSAGASAATLVLVYGIARSISPQSGRLNGAFSLLLLFGSPIVLELLIAPLVDTTALLVLLAIIGVYLYSARRGHSSRAAIAALGFALFVGLRTKETLFSAVVLLPGLGFDKDGVFVWSRMLERMRYLIAGAVAAAAVNLLANAALLGDPLFGFRPADFIEYRRIWAGTIGSADRGGQTFSELVLGQHGLVFLLFLLAGLSLRQVLKPSIRLIWLVPVALLTITILFSTRVGWVISERGFAPGLATMCILAGQVVSQRELLAADRRARTLAGAAVLTLFAGLTGLGFGNQNELGFSIYFEAVFVPLIVLAGLAASVVAAGQISGRAVVTLLAVPLAFVGVIVRLQPMAADAASTSVNARFQPLMAFEQQLRASEFESLFVSASLLPALDIDDNRDELAALVNTALDLDTVRTNYRIGEVDATFLLELESGQPTLALLARDDWDWMRTAPQDRPEWRGKYEGTVDASGRYVLLRLISQAVPP